MQTTYQEALNHHQHGRLKQAQHGYKAVLVQQPHHFESLHMLGVLAYQTGHHQAAVDLISHALEVQPDHPGACSNLGLALGKLHRPELALAAFDRAIACKPDYATAYLNRGNTLAGLNQFAAAIASFNHAIAIQPNLVEAYVNRGSSLLELDQTNAALQSFDQAIALRPERADLHSRRGHALMELDDMANARVSYRTALALAPDYSHARLGLTFACLPAIASNTQALDSAREELAQALDELDAWVESRQHDLAFSALGSCHPFYLAYQEHNNVELLSRYGDTCSKIATAWQAARNLRPDPGPGVGKIRLGIVSNHIREHSVWQALIKGWICELDKTRFELHLFCLNTTHDDATELGKRVATSVTEQLDSVEAWARAILARRIEVLCYPEIGMHALTFQLATLRLAPIQLASWGHPESSGLRTIDYFLSAELLEPDDAALNYREQLIKLPNLGCHYTPESVRPLPLDLASLGIDANAPILLCPGTPFKYGPARDHVLVEIARQLDTAQFVFFTHKHNWLSERLAKRLNGSFEAAGLKYDDHVRFIPWQPKEAFYGLLGQATVFLDSLGFSGFNTAIQALDCQLPVVTCAGRFMRGRLASGLLRRMQLDALVAMDEAEYIALAIRLCKDAHYRETIQVEISRRKNTLFLDAEPVRALERFCLETCRPHHITSASSPHCVV